jgi:hypothetical protein
LRTHAVSGLADQALIDWIERGLSVRLYSRHFDTPVAGFGVLVLHDPPTSDFQPVFGGFVEELVESFLESFAGVVFVGHLGSGSGASRWLGATTRTRFLSLAI